MIEPLALDPSWHQDPPLISLDEALERSALDRSLSREELIKRMLADVAFSALHPLLWILPRRWRVAPAELPAHLQALSTLLQEQLLSPVLLAALIDDLNHLLPPVTTGRTALERWQADSVRWNGSSIPLPDDLEALLRIEINSGTGNDADLVARSSSPLAHLSGGIRWDNEGLNYSQPSTARCHNALLAQVLNRLAANPISHDRFSFSSCVDGAALVCQLQDAGWRVHARFRCNVSSFGYGASLRCPERRVLQVPLALPMRTGLLMDNEEEIRTLLPHASLELGLQRSGTQIWLQWFQGVGGYCGWAGLNDLNRPWQNDRQNGTVRYFDDALSPAELPLLMHLSEWIALVHNQEASAHHLRLGGYGSLGFCIDSSALLQQSLRGRTDLFPLLLSGCWRERLDRRAAVLAKSELEEARLQACEAYRCALAQLPIDITIRGDAAMEARRRLRCSLPDVSPFVLIREVHDITSCQKLSGS